MNSRTTITSEIADHEFSNPRLINAPRELVWEAWTERERLLQRFGPKSFTMTTGKLDLRPGGIFHYGLRSPDGKEMWGKFVNRENAASERIVPVISFFDEKGGPGRHPFAPTGSSWTSRN